MELWSSDDIGSRTGPDQGECSGLSVHCWGTRGSIPSPGPTTAGYGGNTSCVEIQSGDRRIILDAGTGIRNLGEKLNTDRSITQATIFLTHFHWDHIQGFPFFAPAYNPEFDLTIIGPEQKGVPIESLLMSQMSSAYFPIPYEALSADLTFHHQNDGAWQDGGIQVTAMRMRHTSHTVGYRVEAPGSTVVFIPDNELLGGAHPAEPGWMEKLLEFVSGADLLLHDAMFTEDEYRSREGWGHSTFGQALDLASRALVKEIRFFHHAPGRSDGELDEILATIRQGAAEDGLDLAIHAAAEGDRIHLGNPCG